MDNYADAIKYIEQQEATNISYVKIGNNNKKLVVGFGTAVVARHASSAINKGVGGDVWRQPATAPRYGKS